MLFGAQRTNTNLSNFQWAEIKGAYSSVKIQSHQYKKSHFGDDRNLWLSYLHNGIFYHGKMASFHWNGPKTDSWRQECIAGVM